MKGRGGGRVLQDLLLTILLVLLVVPALAHEARPAYLQLRQTDAETYDVLWKVPGLGEDKRLALDVEFAPGTTTVDPQRMSFVSNAFVQRWRVRRAGGLDGTSVRIAGLQATLTDVLVRLERLDGTTQHIRVVPASPEFVIEAAPGRWDVARTYLGLGVEHILLGIDHLLFVLALVILVNGARRLFWTITAFTAAHSLTLAAATLGWVHVPPPPVEASIALSIVFLATEIIHARAGRPGLTYRQPWIVAFLFGLLHGLGFAGALSEVGLPINAIPVALLFFNVGVEVGQLLFISAVLAVMTGARRIRLPRNDWSWKVPVYAIGSVAAYWTIDRISGF
ncbi:HupE/UreJ family protein [Lysobacter niastensis]|uniref:HupE/UreJ family protein n=1 Tax=Lysobacter niastensis TaxID=380629 RepID=A0ABS0B5H3_9GAMM|nr:HupE/UreJ family protein [Lysobacter niastensis]MBF6024023.1 HupE/UreJ family protein [Lysobacter niastensis]